MESKEESGFINSEGSNPEAPRYSTSAAGRDGRKLHVSIRKRYFELLDAWLRDGHTDLPTEEDILLFLEGEL